MGKIKLFSSHVQGRRPGKPGNLESLVEGFVVEPDFFSSSRLRKEPKPRGGAVGRNSSESLPLRSVKESGLTGSESSSGSSLGARSPLRPEADERLEDVDGDRLLGGPPLVVELPDFDLALLDVRSFGF